MNNEPLERFELVAWGTLVKMSKKLDDAADSSTNRQIYKFWSVINSRVGYQILATATISLLLGITSGYILFLFI